MNHKNQKQPHTDVLKNSNIILQDSIFKIYSHKPYSNYNGKREYTIYYLQHMTRWMKINKQTHTCLSKL